MAVKRKEKPRRTARKVEDLNLKTFEPSEEWDFKVTFENVGEKRAFFEDSKLARDEADDAYLFPWLAKFIRRWPYEGNPADETSYDKLTLAEWNEVQQRLLQALATFLANPV